MALTAPLDGLQGPERLTPSEARRLADDLREARARTRALHADLKDQAWRGPCLSIVNPPLWELGHVGYFQEWWCLREAGGRPSLLPGADALYDSSRVPHRTRWDLPLPDPAATWAYLDEVLARVLERLERAPPSASEAYFLRLVVAHEDMHDEAFLYTRQTFARPPPAWLAGVPLPEALTRGPGGDVEIPGGTFWLGARRDREPFVFDNERWAHPVGVAPFAMARLAVTEGEFEAFVEDGGYRRADLWSAQGWAWREREQADAPLYWRRDGGRWWRRVFDLWQPLQPGRALIHVGWHEAQAWCRWAGRRLPSEAEWEAAATHALRAPEAPRAFPWGGGPIAPRHANLGARTLGPVAADAFPAGDSPGGLRQLLGNVWEWCDDAFGPYPGFAPDPYAEYSAPWFATHRVLRGGCWATEARLLRSTWRNFYTPDRRDVLAGFRTCRAERS